MQLKLFLWSVFCLRESLFALLGVCITILSWHGKYWLPETVFSSGEKHAGLRLKDHLYAPNQATTHTYWLTSRDRTPRPLFIVSPFFSSNKTQAASPPKKKNNHLKLQHNTYTHKQEEQQLNRMWGRAGEKPESGQAADSGQQDQADMRRS